MSASNDGYKIVLTADRTLMSNYNGSTFLGFGACFPKGLIPDRLYFSLFCPSIQVNKDGSAKFAPYGLRKIEAALLNNGFSRDEVIVAHPEHIDRVIGPNTKILAITETDPLGIGPATTTFTQFFGGETYMFSKFKELLNNAAVQTYKPKIIVGGPGAWQLESKETQERFGLDCVVLGEGEKVINAIVTSLINGKAVPNLIHGDTVDEADIPLINEPTIDGIVEITRGCGRGCAFCLPTLQRFRCLPVEHILREVEINVKAGKRPLLHGEDVLRYKANGFTVNREAVVDLFSKVKNHPGVESVAISHFALSSVASTPELISDLSDIFELKKQGSWFGGQTGIETGSPKLMRELMAGKCKPFTPEQWPDMVVHAFEVLAENNWIPLSTIIIGLPHETENDVELTLDLVKKLHAFKSLIVPLFFVSEGGLKNKSESFEAKNLTAKQSELALTCWSHNLDWADIFLRDYFRLKNPLSAYCVERVFHSAVKTARDVIHRCKRDYNFDLATMIKDVQNGSLRIAPLPVQLVLKIMTRANKSKEG